MKLLNTRVQCKISVRNEGMCIFVTTSRRFNRIENIFHVREKIFHEFGV